MARQRARCRKFPQASKAARHLSAIDSRLARLIERVGTIRIDLDPDESVFESLASSIVYQQLHGKAAATILARFKEAHCRGLDFPDPEVVARASFESLRDCGLSGSKASAIQDLARKTLAGVIPDRAVAERMNDDELIEALTQVKGVGPWTAQMFLIFTMGRPDVLPTGDYGVRKGFAAVHGMKSLPSPLELQSRAETWAPYRSAGSWYMWRALELEPYRAFKPQESAKTSTKGAKKKKPRSKVKRPRASRS